MAKLKATPKNYAEALTTLNGKQSIRLGNNTYLEQRKQPGDGLTERIAVRLHSTDIVVFYPSGRVTLHTGGWYKPTTKERLNRFIKPSAYVYQKAHKWYVLQGDVRLDFFEGFVLFPSL